MGWNVWNFHKNNSGKQNKRNNKCSKWSNMIADNCLIWVYHDDSILLFFPIFVYVYIFSFWTLLKKIWTNSFYLISLQDSFSSLFPPPFLLTFSEIAAWLTTSTSLFTHRNLSCIRCSWHCSTKASWTSIIFVLFLTPPPEHRGFYTHRKEGDRKWSSKQAWALLKEVPVR